VSFSLGGVGGVVIHSAVAEEVKTRRVLVAGWLTECLAGLLVG
jgi:hypothetical protein